jgi:leucyl/phenylalanyl-tRNA--protein transferase
MASQYFPNPQESSPEGIVAIGGELSAECLLDAYAHGIFPWPMQGVEPLLWWSPDPRAILPLDGFRASRRLFRRVNSDKLAVTADQAFREVMEGCATGPGREEGTWITPAMIEGYVTLHHLGHAHSVEVWLDEKLVGGVYGVTVGGLFAAESMFYRARDASKVALLALVEHLNQRGYRLLDVQQWTPHTGRLGVIEIPRRRYLRQLATAVDQPVTWGDFQ